MVADKNQPVAEYQSEEYSLHRNSSSINGRAEGDVVGFSHLVKTEPIEYRANFKPEPRFCSKEAPYSIKGEYKYSGIDRLFPEYSQMICWIT